MITAPPLFQPNWGKWYSCTAKIRTMAIPICWIWAPWKIPGQAGTSSQQFSSKCPAETGQLFLRGTLRRVGDYPHFIGRETEVKWFAQDQTEKDGDGVRAVAAHIDVHLRLTQTCIWPRRSSTPRCSCPAGLSRPTLLVLTLGFPDPNFTRH